MCEQPIIIPATRHVQSSQGGLAFRSLQDPFSADAQIGCVCRLENLTLFKQDTPFKVLCKLCTPTSDASKSGI